MATAELLRLDGLTAGYGQARALFDISFVLRQGEPAAVLGRNGMGKTTLLASLIGATRRFAGRIGFGGTDVTGWPSHRRARAGIGWVPQEREIFPSLTVDENLTAVARPGGWTPRRVFDLFPRLEERRRNFGNQLSGGEQQMLAIGRALVVNPRLLLLDEPLEGLAPIIVQELLAAIRRMVQHGDLTILLVEQHAARILPLTETALVLERGRIVHQGPSAALAADPALLDRLIGLAGTTSRGAH